MVYPAGPKGKLEKNTSTFGSLATLLAKKEGGFSCHVLNMQNSVLGLLLGNVLCGAPHERLCHLLSIQVKARTAAARHRTRQAFYRSAMPRPL